MASTVKLVTQVWEWLERLAARRAATSSRVQSDYVTWRRREMMRRAAGQIGVY